MEDSKLNEFSYIISHECNNNILNQMENIICKIKNNKNEQYTGFFCKIPYPDINNMIPVFISNNNIINNYDKEITIETINFIKNIQLKYRMIYKNRLYNITIIEIKEEDNIIHYLELDDKIISNIRNKKNENIEYINNQIYILQYPEGNLALSYSIIDDVNKYYFNHKCKANKGALGSPILNINNNKVIGIFNKDNNGIFLTYPINKFILENKYNNIKLYEIFYKNNILNDLNFHKGLKILKEFNREYNLFKNIKKFNYKYKLDIKYPIKENLELCDKGIKNEEFGDLCKIEFYKLKELVLNYNKISDIKMLVNTNFKELQKLDLSGNQISDITAIENLDFKELEILNLTGNNISDIEVFKNADFKQLKELYLDGNNITDIQILEKVKFKELEKLFLNGNKISNIKVLENVDFKKLKMLNLRDNNISDINILGKVNFCQLKELDLSYNKISNIEVLKNVKFKQLQTFDLSRNNISDINGLENPNFNKLKELDLSFNQIKDDIKVLDKIIYYKLESLDLRGNNIDMSNSSIYFSYMKMRINNIYY